MNQTEKKSFPYPDKQARKLVSKDEMWTTSLDNLTSLVQATAPSQAVDVLSQYTAKLCELLLALKPYGSERVLKRMITALRNNDLGSYINEACELTAAGHFLKLDPQCFKYQVPTDSGVVSSRKNFDFSFSVDGFVFNVEVKSFKPEALDKERRKVKSFLPPPMTHRLIQKGDVFEANCMPALKRLMDKATAQLPVINGEHNVMLLSCNDPDEFSDIWACLIGPFGLCRTNEPDGSTPSLEKYPHIDTVVICLIGLQHLCVLNPEYRSKFFPNSTAANIHGSTAWDYCKAFSISVNLRQLQLTENQGIAIGRSFNIYDAHVYPHINSNLDNMQIVFFELFNQAWRNMH